MVGTSQEALLLAIETREALFASLEEMVGNENYLKVIPEIQEGRTQGEIADAVGVSRPTVTRSINTLRELELVEETEEGYRFILPVLQHPIMTRLFEKEVLDGG